MGNHLEKLSETINDFPKVVDGINNSYSRCKEFAEKFLAHGAIKSKEEDESFVNAISTISKTKAKINNMRKPYTASFDAVKKEFTSKENELNEFAKRLAAARNLWANEQLKKKRELEFKAISEKTAQIKAIEYEKELSFNLENMADNLFAKTEKYLSNALISTDLEELEKSKAKLSMKPELKIELYESLFSTKEIAFTVEGYEDFGTSSRPTDSIHASLKAKYPFDSIQELYVKSTKSLLEDYKEKFASRISQLTIIEDDNKAKQEDRKKKLEEEARQAALAIENKEKDRNQILQAQKEKEAENKIINAEIEAQAKMQVSDKTNPTSKGQTLEWVAEIEMLTSYSDIIAFYIKEGGDQTKLDFLLKFLVKNGKPEIEGVKYRSFAKTKAIR